MLLRKQVIIWGEKIGWNPSLPPYTRWNNDTDVKLLK